MTEPDRNNSIRLYADYMLLSDEPPLIWADMVLGDAKRHGTILEYEVLAHNDEGPAGLAYLYFTAVVPFGTVFHDRDNALRKVHGGMGAVEGRDAVQALLELLVGEEDISCRWVHGYYHDAIPAQFSEGPQLQEDGHMEWCERNCDYDAANDRNACVSFQIRENG